MLPLEVKALGFSVHRGFDTIAMDVAAADGAQHMLTPPADALQQGATWHNTWQLEVACGSLPVFTPRGMAARAA